MEDPGKEREDGLVIGPPPRRLVGRMMSQHSNQSSDSYVKAGTGRNVYVLSSKVQAAHAMMNLGQRSSTAIQQSQILRYKCGIDKHVRERTGMRWSKAGKTKSGGLGTI